MAKEKIQTSVDTLIINSLFGDMIKDLAERPKTEGQARLMIRAFELIIEKVKLKFDIKD